MIKKQTIGKAAQLTGIGVETIRFYERKGLIDQPPKPAAGGFRDYSPETINQIAFVRQAQETGFSLREIKELLSLRADPATDCAEVRDRARSKLEEVDRRMEQLGRIRDALEELIAACPGEGALKKCTIIESFNSGDGNDNHTATRRNDDDQ